MLTYSLTLLRRRLWVVVLAFALCGVAGAQVLVFVPPVQQSEASVLFVPSAKEPGVTEPTNPLLSLGGAVAIVASVVQVAVTDDQTQLKLVGSSGTASYTVVPDLGENAGPILMVTTQSTDAAASNRLRDQVVQEIQQNLASLQSSQQVSSDLRISTVVLTRSLEPTVVRKAQIQIGVVVFSVLMLACLALILLAEHRGARRRSRRAAGSVAPSEDLTVPTSRTVGQPETAQPEVGPAATRHPGEQHVGAGLEEPTAPEVRTRRQARETRHPSSEQPEADLAASRP